MIVLNNFTLMWQRVQFARTMIVVYENQKQLFTFIPNTNNSLKDKCMPRAYAEFYIIEMSHRVQWILSWARLYDLRESTGFPWNERHTLTHMSFAWELEFHFVTPITYAPFNCLMHFLVFCSSLIEQFVELQHLWIICSNVWINNVRTFERKKKKIGTCLGWHVCVFIFSLKMDLHKSHL